MYNTEDQVREETATDLSGLDGLQLDMDYDQIMHYFENLKVGVFILSQFIRNANSSFWADPPRKIAYLPRVGFNKLRVIEIIKKEFFRIL